MLAGAAPIPTSSGQKERYRLNRSGDREVNCALRTVVVTRMACDARTQAYFERRRAQGKSDREIQRCLKRYVARRLFHVMDGHCSASIAAELTFSNPVAEWQSAGGRRRRPSATPDYYSPD